MDYKNEDDEPVILREPLELYGKRKFTEQEYLDLTATSEEFYEYYRGEIFTMAVDGWQHAKLQANLTIEIGQHLKGRECNVFSQSLRVHIEKNGSYTHPDISVVCYDLSAEEESNDEKLEFIQPSVIIEVLSPSTRNYDQGDKFGYYKDIPEFKEYIVVDAAKVTVIHHKKNDDETWTTQKFDKLSDILKIHCINFSMCLSDIYTGTGIKEGGKLIRIKRKK